MPTYWEDFSGSMVGCGTPPEGMDMSKSAQATKARLMGWSPKENSSEGNSEPKRPDMGSNS